MKRLAIFAIAATVIGTAGAAWADTDAKDTVLGAEELKLLFPGNYKARVAGYDMLITGSINGGLKGRAFNRGDSGRWWVEEDTLCVAWSNWTSGEAMCGEITRKGEWFYSRNEEGEGMKFRRIQEVAWSTHRRFNDDLDDTP